MVGLGLFAVLLAWPISCVDDVLEVVQLTAKTTQGKGLTVGSSSSSSKCLNVGAKAAYCPRNASYPGVRLNGDTYPDIFYSCYDGDSRTRLCLYRLDGTDWGLDLKIDCHDQIYDGYTYSGLCADDDNFQAVKNNQKDMIDVPLMVGASSSRSKCLEVGSDAAYCPSNAGYPDVRLNGDPNGDMFGLCYDGDSRTSLCVYRLDGFDWGLELEIDCHDQIYDGYTYSGLCADDAHFQAVQADPEVMIDLPEPTASGDPHVVNVRGEHFDIWSTGSINMLRIPRSSTPFDADMTVLADVRANSVKPCAPTYIQGLTVRHRLGRTRALGVLVIVPGLDGAPIVHETTGDQAGLQVLVSLKSLNVQVGEQLLRIHQTCAWGMCYLNLGIKHVPKDAGGLLGADDHADVSRPRLECESLATQRVAVRFSSTAVGYDGNPK